MSESFFSRWSRQKRAAAQPTEPVQAEPAHAAVQVVEQSARGDAEASSVPTSSAGSTSQQTALPTLEDVQALTPASDFQPFMQQGVGSEVRNAAMKKLFADPHFNVMDGLDIYIDDYSQPDPMPSGMLRRMASAQFLGLVPKEAPERQPQAAAVEVLNPPPADGMELVAQSPGSSASADIQNHDHPDLQLQPDPAPADPQPGPGPQ